ARRPPRSSGPCSPASAQPPSAGDRPRRLPTRVLHEVVEPVRLVGPRPAVPAAAYVTAHPAGTVVGGAGRAVPQAGVVEQHVAAVAVDRDLAPDLLEAGRHPGVGAAVRARHDAEEAVLR